MNLKDKHIILGSASPRRRELLGGLDIEFTVDTGNTFQENFHEIKAFHEIPAMMSEGKSHGFHRPLEDNETKQDTPLFDEEIGGVTLMQLHGKYILTSVKSGLMMIDQQRAHARILYERFMQQMKDNRGVSQKLLFPEILELSSDDVHLFEELMADLRLVGFDIDRFDKCAYSVNGVPADMDGGDPILVLNDILSLVRDGHSDIQQARLERIALALSKTAMLKSAKELSEMEMRDLLDKLFACKNHAYSPDGKPVIALLAMGELEKYF